MNKIVKLNQLPAAEWNIAVDYLIDTQPHLLDPATKVPRWARFKWGKKIDSVLWDREPKRLCIRRFYPYGRCVGFPRPVLEALVKFLLPQDTFWMLKQYLCELSHSKILPKSWHRWPSIWPSLGNEVYAIRQQKKVYAMHLVDVLSTGTLLLRSFGSGFQHAFYCQPSRVFPTLAAVLHQFPAAQVVDPT